MFVQMNQTLSDSIHGVFKYGVIYEVMDAMGASWIRRGLATLSTKPPAYIAEFLARMDEGTGETCLFLPYVGEFGHMVMTWLRLVHWHKARKKIVCCRPGEEALYPSADEFFTDWVNPIPDAQRCQAGKSRRWPTIEKQFPKARPILSGSMTPSQLRTAIEPGKPIPFRPKRRGLEVDVCIGTRYRELATERNWRHWQTVADGLRAAGYNFATIGIRPTAPDLIGQAYHTADFDTDAAIELLQNSRLYLGSDSGNTHLAAAAGAKVRLIKGHPRDGYVPMMQHVNSDVAVIEGGWENAEAVIAEAIRILEDRP